MSLFDSRHTWLDQPRIALAELLVSDRFRFTNQSSMTLPARHRLSKSSTKVYMAMFDKFQRHLVLKQVGLLDASGDDVGTFMDGEMGEASGETRSRYTRLLERIFEHLCSTRLREENPVSQWVRQRGVGPATGARLSAAKGDISCAEVERLQDWLYVVGAGALERGEWRLARDITLASLSLGTGMRCAELLQLRRVQVKHWPDGPVSERFEVDIPGWASVATARAHRAAAGRDCVSLLEAWWRARWSGFIRAQQPRTADIAHEPGAAAASPAAPPGAPVTVPGDRVFPATLSGKALSVSTLYRNLKTVSELGLQADALTESTRWVLERGAQGLRRAYVLTSLEQGQPPELLTERLGHWHRRSVRRYLDGSGRPGLQKSRAPLEAQGQDRADGLANEISKVPGGLRRKVTVRP